MRAHDEDATQLKTKIDCCWCTQKTISVSKTVSFAFFIYLYNFLAYLHALHAMKIKSIIFLIFHSSFHFFRVLEKKTISKFNSLKNQHETVTRRKPTAAKFVEYQHDLIKVTILWAVARSFALEMVHGAYIAISWSKARTSWYQYIWTLWLLSIKSRLLQWATITAIMIRKCIFDSTW